MDKRALGDRIARLRKIAKMSQDDLASKSGVARRALQMLEKGEGNPTLDTIQSIAQVLKISFEDLTQQTVRKALAESMAKQSQQDPSLFEAGRLLQAIAKASAPRRALILTLAYRDEKYLESLPHEIAQTLRAFAKAF